jgi:hypothetical protein
MGHVESYVCNIMLNDSNPDELPLFNSTQCWHRFQNSDLLFQLFSKKLFHLMQSITPTRLKWYPRLCRVLTVSEVLYIKSIYGAAST